MEAVDAAPDVDDSDRDRDRVFSFLLHCGRRNPAEPVGVPCLRQSGLHPQLQPLLMVFPHLMVGEEFRGRVLEFQP
ncbi:hypothetical protein INR49_016224 [Caranx melampygus]|nr:hypothetical protein INR49_016224 [Caranx melampygus]